jgi:hypothetical protein
MPALFAWKIGLADCGNIVYNLTEAENNGKGHSQDTFIQPQDLALLRVVETAEEAVKVLNEFFGA